MGGQAFAKHKPPLPTPRMSNARYQQFRGLLHQKLATIFQFVGTPIEAPEKTDHGDIDFLVYGYNDPIAECQNRYVAQSEDETEQKQHQQLQVKAVIDLLKPVASMCESGTVNLAIVDPNTPGTYIQIDVNIQPTFERWQWMLFLHSHGDFWSLLGSSLRKVGLVATDKGFFVRDVEIEPQDKKRSMLFLTDRPEEVIDFLCLEPRHFIQPEASLGPEPFRSRTNLFNAVAKSRYFDRASYLDNKALNGNDRHRVKTRDIYRTFIEDFVPSLPGPAEPQIWPNGEEDKRTQTRGEVLAHWGKEQDYKRLKSVWEAEQVELLTKRKFNESRRFRNKELVIYADAWTEWCGFTVMSSEEVHKGDKKKRK